MCPVHCTVSPGWPWGPGSVAIFSLLSSSPGEMVNTEGHQAQPHHACLTGCALTYNSYRRGSRNLYKELTPGQYSLLSVFHSQLFNVCRENLELSKRRRRRRATPPTLELSLLNITLHLRVLTRRDDGVVSASQSSVRTQDDHSMFV